MKRKIANKIVFTIALLSFAIFSILAFNDISSRRNDILPLFVARGEAVARSLESSIANEDELKNQERLANIIEKNLWLDPEIINISFHLPQENDLKVYMSGQNKEIGALSSDQNNDSFNQNKTTNQRKKTTADELLIITAPIHISGQVVGTVQIDFSLGVVNRQIATDTALEIIIYIIALLLFVVALFISLKIMVISRIKKINNSIQNIAQGNFDKTFLIKSQDELGQLSRAVNQMAQTLEKSQREMLHYNESLKDEVLARTNELERTKKQLENANLDLEDKVKERTAELEKLKHNQEKVIKDKTEELNKKLTELEKLNKFMINRENKMIELKKENENLKKKMKQ